VALTFIHTSDWHLGRTYQRLGRHSAEMRQWRFDAVRRVYELAVAERAAFILVAGDVFQTDTPRPDLVDQVVELLRDAPVPTIVIPGNHDPLTEGSVWRRDDFAGRLQQVRNVTLALACEPVELPACRTVVFPCPVTSKTCPEDASDWIPAGTRGGDYRIGLCHGRWQGYSGEPFHVNFIAAQRAERAGLDYLALGDFHSFTPENHPAAQARAFYSGTSECTAVDEERPGHALRVRFDQPGDAPQVTPCRVGRMRPVQLPPIVVSPGDGFDAVRSAVDAIEQPEDVLLGLSVSGALGDDEMQAFIDWSNALDERFLGVDRALDELFLEPNEADFDALELAPAERRVLERLRQTTWADESGSDELAPLLTTLASDPEVRREALALYYRRLKHEGSA
jgi:DNA repair exonuclease SbcCD nuclease subunit